MPWSPTTPATTAPSTVGRHLDGLVADLLELLGASAPHALRP
ncbi:hypothetical protein ACWC6I_07765 [Streptomyces sp. NPDC001414]